MYYKTIFNVNIFHSYFLDDGNTIFSSLTDTQKKVVLQNYDVSSYLKMVPVSTTIDALINQRIIYKKHAQGFRIITSCLEDNSINPAKYIPEINLKETQKLTFSVYSKDTFFKNYTNVNTELNSRIYCFTNTPNEVANFTKNIFSGTEVNNDFLLDENSSLALIKKIVQENNFSNENITLFSIINQVHTIEKDLILTTLEKEVKIEELLTQYLKEEKRKGFIGFIRLTIKGENIANDLLEFDTSNPSDIKQFIKPSIEFTLNFTNRNMIWAYKNSVTNEELKTNTTQPIVKNGFIKLKKTDFTPTLLDDAFFPNPTVRDIKIDATSTFYSEIFI